jgi:limonene-1,2-epoxide hydrolase
MEETGTSGEGAPDPWTLFAVGHADSGGGMRAMGEDENRGALERFWAALERQDFDAAAEEIHEEFEETYPQSGEHIVGKDNFVGLLKAFPGFPDVKVRRHRGGGDLWVTEAVFDYAKDGSTPWEVCEVQEVRDGKLRSITAFFGAPFDPATWRVPFVEPR